jgi:hypothetical protein
VNCVFTVNALCLCFPPLALLLPIIVSFLLADLTSCDASNQLDTVGELSEQRTGRLFSLELREASASRLAEASHTFTYAPEWPCFIHPARNPLSHGYIAGRP